VLNFARLFAAICSLSVATGIPDKIGAALQNLTDDDLLAGHAFKDCFGIRPDVAIDRNNQRE
jgi:hypothetical protein